MAYTTKFLFVFSSIAMLLVSAYCIAYIYKGSTFKHGVDESNGILQAHQEKQAKWGPENILSSNNKAIKLSIPNSRDHKRLATEKPSSWVIPVSYTHLTLPTILLV